jgi:hypothetical protein
VHALPDLADNLVTFGVWTEVKSMIPLPFRLERSVQSIWSASLADRIN